MEPDHKAQREPIEIPPEFTQGRETSRDPSVRQSYRYRTISHGRGFGKRVRAAAATQMHEDQYARPEPTSRTRRDVGPFCRATVGHVVWRAVPSWHQQRTPSTDAQAFHRTKSPPWIRKRKARRKAQLQKASRKLNRG